ncbi:MAG: molybdopterin-dependent oxidoreductase [Acidimicrobiia bacterium]
MDLTNDDNRPGAAGAARIPSFMERKRAELRSRGIDPDRLPPGQYVTDRFPVLHLGPVPSWEPSTWTLEIGGDAVAACSLTWSDFRDLPVTELVADIHCVTKWSKFDVVWRGVTLDDLLAATHVDPQASTLLAWGEHGYSSNVALDELRDNPCLLAFEVGGAPLEPEHGAPLRLVIPHLYFWKSVKWLRRVELWRDPSLVGFWEQHGYHRHGDPFREQRYWGDDA